ncbi:hypothetical protein B0T21DRAFT_344004 [Apiosordaria backusii]|uniref:Uncharacterized protein n=1 Tax=Apiosordaria backusii TaxID=314023 RepID=A0AA40EZQ0_9PEZI|nr:hypothetical protein B0T21DRAFT_344004 [Apiosordaria backusii]
MVIPFDAIIPEDTIVLILYSLTYKSLFLNLSFLNSLLVNIKSLYPTYLFLLTLLLYIFIYYSFLIINYIINYFKGIYYSIYIKDKGLIKDLSKKVLFNVKNKLYILKKILDYLFETAIYNEIRILIIVVSYFNPLVFLLINRRKR